MSLTSHLEDKSSPIYHFFSENFSDAVPARATLASTDDVGVVFGRCDPDGERPRKPAWRLGEPQVLPRSEDRAGYPWDTVGTMFDYRVRFLFPSREGDHRVARSGASRLIGHWTSQLDVPPAYVDLERRLADLRRVEPSKRGDASFERDLGALCFALALYEQVFRMGGPDERQILFRMGPMTMLDEILELASEAVLDDITELTRLLVSTQTSLLASVVTPNPSFVASNSLNGADADLIAGRRLLDVKVTKSSTIERISLWQIMGYALCDLDDFYEIEEVGLYYARHGIQVVWPVEDLLALMAGRRIELRRIRVEFGELLRALRTTH